ncbi:50S ribosomal protein L22 [Patescibacteria group bacterium]|nr:50S ribosomal protein L22 [Patescibacteria group bacterium]
MEITAQAKSIRVSPRKIRLVADVIRKLSLEDALKTLTVIKKRGAYSLEKTLRSAVSNAGNKDIKTENLIIKSIDVLEGPAFKRFHPSTRGRVHPYKKRTSHITIKLAEKTQKPEINTKKKEAIKG